MNIDGAIPLADLIQNMIRTPQGQQLMQHKDMQPHFSPSSSSGGSGGSGNENDPIKAITQFSDDHFGTTLQPSYMKAITGIKSAMDSASKAVTSQLSDVADSVIYAITPSSTATAAELGATGTVGGASASLGGTAGLTAGEATAAAAGTAEAVVGTEGAAATAASTEAGSSWLSALFL